MHNPIRFHTNSADIIDRSIDVKERNFMQNLYNLGNNVCHEIYPKHLLEKDNNLKDCRNEIMVASSCVLMNKANNNLGDYRDNVYLCKHEINLMEKQMVNKFNEFPKEEFSKFLQGLSHSTKSFC